MLKSSLLFTIPLLFCSCAAKDDANVVEPKVQPEVPIPEPVKLPTLEAAVASVQFQEDCPDAPAPTQAPAAPAKRAPPSDAPAGAAGVVAYVPPCIQSRLQITFAGDASQAQPVSIAEIRLLSEDGKVLSTIKSRAPSTWTNNSYTPWDEVVGAGNTQASYKISPPAWGAVETALGKGSYGATFVVEVDISAHGKTKTIRSNSFVRSRPVAPPPRGNLANTRIPMRLAFRKRLGRRNCAATSAQPQNAYVAAWLHPKAAKSLIPCVLSAVEKGPSLAPEVHYCNAWSDTSNGSGLRCPQSTKGKNVMPRSLSRPPNLAVRPAYVGLFRWQSSLLYV